MIKRILAITVLSVIIINLSACSANKVTRYEKEYLMLFDTVTKIVAYAHDREEFEVYSRLIYDNLKQYNELFDIYNDYDGINNIKTINDNAGIMPVKVDKKIIGLLNFAKEEYKNTYGKMNVALGSVLKIWHDYREEGIKTAENARLPLEEELKFAANHTDINGIIIDEQSSTVFLNDPYMRLDVGAIGKGFAVEQVSGIALQNGVTSAIINVGGNVRVIGSKGDSGKPWNVGIQNPNKDNSILYNLNLSDSSLVTSGDYERYYEVNGKRYHHIIDPQTLYPSEYFTSVSIICKDSALADALSTAIFNMPFEQGKELIEGLHDAEALWIFKNGEVKCSKNFNKYIK